MAYFEDLSIYNYSNELNDTSINIGWLDGKYEFHRGKVTDEFLTSLWEYIKIPINRTRGIHQDILLENGERVFVAKYQGYSIILGSAEIRVIDVNCDKIYAAPNMILHYIINHQYLPPRCFINAVINGPKPDSDCYKKVLINKNNAKYTGKLSCIYCGSNKLQLGFIHNICKNQCETMKILEESYGSNSRKISEDSIYDIICRNCGSIYTIPVKELF